MTMLLAAVLVLNPIGRDIVDSAFFLGERLSRNIWQSIALIAMAILATMVSLEWALRTLILKRRARARQELEFTST
jgi:uncharacterized membrane protein